MAANSNNIEIKLRFLTERLDSIQTSMKELEGLKRAALSTSTALKGLLSVGALKVAFNEVAATFAEVKKAIDLGGELSDLSANTGQTVGDLVVLRQAFENAGMGAGATGQSLALLQKALTGVNEEGEPTSKAFERLGISMETLKSQSALQQLQTLNTAFATLQNPADRTRAAMELFGRSGARMLALLSDASALSVAKDQVGSLADTMEQNAAAFDKLGDSWNAIGLRATQLFAGIAEEIAPMLQSIADQANAMDFTTLGREVGQLVNGLAELLRIAAPLAVVLGTQFVLEKTLAGLAAFAGKVTASTTALAAETAALNANTAAQAANAAARGGGGAMRGAGGAGVPGRGAAGPAADWKALSTALGGVTGKLAGFGNALAGLIGPMGGVAIGVGIGNEIQDKFFNWASSLAAGGASTEADVRAANERLGRNEVGQLMERATKLGSAKELQDLKDEAGKRLETSRAELKGMGWNQTMEKRVVSQDISALERLLETLGRKDGGQIEAQAQAKDAAAKNAERNAQRGEVQKNLATGLAEENQRAAFEALSDEKKLAVLRPELKKQAGIVDSSRPEIGGKEREEAAAKVLEITRQINELEAKIAKDKRTKAEAQAKEAAAKAEAQAKEAAAKAETRAALEAELQLSEAMASGNQKLVERLKWMQDYNALLKQAREAGIENPEKFATRGADANAAKETADKGTRRQGMELGLRYEEAMASGNKEEAARVKWVQDYTAQLKEAKDAGVANPEDFARRKANLEQEKETKPNSVFSAMARYGGAAGERYVPARDAEAGARQRLIVSQEQTNALLKQYISQKPVKIDQTARFAA